MSCFSTLKIHPDLVPELDKVSFWQNKSLPLDEETEFCCGCYDGEIRSDGRFVREDAKWNPDLTGWISLVADDPTRNDKICIRLERGVMAELILGDEPPGPEPDVSGGWGALGG